MMSLDAVKLAMKRLLGLATGIFAAAAVHAMELDRIIAVVDEDVVMQSELEEQMLRVRMQLRQQGTEMPPTQVLERQVMERLVLEKIQLQVADRAGVEVEETALDRAVMDIAARNKLSMDQFREILESEGHPFGEFREQIRQEIIMAKLRKSEVDNRVKVRDQEIENFLINELTSEDNALEYRLSHILIALPPGADNDERRAAREKAEDVLARVDAGEDFGALAISVSDGQTALDKGDLGWRKGQEIPTLFADAVSTMDIGDISGMITSPSGFHIVKLTDRRSGEKIMIEQHKVRHILIKPNELLPRDEALRRMTQLRLRLDGGADFAQLARTNSDDRGTALEGGDLGWVSQGQMVPEFEEVMLAGNIGELSAPFESEFGFHILQVMDRREIDGTEEVKRDRARRAIRQRKIDETRQTWLRRLRDEAYVEYRNEE
jgi:peptidyl-prolyl cis-trans isomerase SurA